MVALVFDVRFSARVRHVHLSQYVVRWWREYDSLLISAKTGGAPTFSFHLADVGRLRWFIFYCIWRYQPWVL